MAEVPMPGKPAQQTPNVNIQPVASAVGSQKPPMGKRLFHAFFMANSPKEIFDNLLFKVLVPETKKLVEGLFGKALHMAFFGQDLPSPPQSQSSGYGGTFVNYGQYSQTQAGQVLQVRAPIEFAMPIVPTKEEAERVIQQLRGYIQQDKNGSVSVSKLYTMVVTQDGQPYHIPDYPDEYIGWYDLSAARPKQIGPGQWLVELPKAVYIR